MKRSPTIQDLLTDLLAQEAIEETPGAEKWQRRDERRP